MSIVMGTAGHIDHGKTTLIKALTGIDCDRLKDEKKRGITIELGFAYLDLPNGVRLSIVDVPGHEKFVKNMVAGAMGIDFVLLTVAADEGIMPQTREHIEICKLLGIEQGIVAITKIDMVDEELLELAIEDVKDYLKDTFLKNAPIIPVSSHTGEGIDALTTALLDMVNNIKGKKSSDIFVLPIDRVFTLKGHGTVITGTLVSGEITVGERVMVYPDKKISKVRHIQVHGETVEKVGSGRRTAINLANLEVEDIRRGEILARPDTLFPSLAWDVKISCLSSSPRPILNRKEVHFHHGTIETLARIYLLDRDKLEPGEQGYAQVKFSHPMVGLFGDRFVIRSFSPLRTIGGGEIIDEKEINSGQTKEKYDLPYEFYSASQLLEQCKKNSFKISELMMENEKSMRSVEEIKKSLLDIWGAMENSIKEGCQKSGTLPITKIKRRANTIYKKLKAKDGFAMIDPLEVMDWVNLWALAVNEENACGSKIVTAPTNGAAGIIPAVMQYMNKFLGSSLKDFHEHKVINFLLTAGAIGLLYQRNASISGAAVGCQGEVGVACSMAAAALAESMGGTIEQVENAAEIAMEHNLGLTCDPVNGLVQVPCIERNAMAAIKAINAARMALNGDGKHFVSLDNVIKTMFETGKDMMKKYKETSLGGLAVNIVEC